MESWDQDLRAWRLTREFSLFVHHGESAQLLTRWTTLGSSQDRHKTIPEPEICLYISNQAVMGVQRASVLDLLYRNKGAMWHFYGILHRIQPRELNLSVPGNYSLSKRSRFASKTAREAVLYMGHSWTGAFAAQR
jgi:hypothetical protein